MESLDLKRARFAVEKINSVAQSGSYNADSYKTAIKKIIPMIHANGVIAALAYGNGKGGEMEVVTQTIFEWFQKDELRMGREIGNIQDLTKLNSREVLHVTKEAMSILNWLNRMAEGILRSAEPSS